jgi:hypothetical protein
MSGPPGPAPQTQTDPETPPNEVQGISLDRFLTFGGIVVSIAFFLLPKTPAVVVGSILLMFFLFLHPLLRLPWTRATNSRRLGVVLSWLFACLCLVFFAWPPPATQIPSVGEIASEVWRRAPKAIPAPAPPTKPQADQSGVDSKDSVSRRFPSLDDAAKSTATVGKGRADLKLEFIGRDRLQFMDVADSDESANQPKRFFGLWDINRPFFYEQYPGVVQPLPLTVRTTMDFVFRNSKQGPDDVIDTPIALAHVKPGDRLFGMANVTCLNCERQRGYWVYFEVGKGGWYAEMGKATWGQPVQVPKQDSTDEQQAAVLDLQVPRKLRITIPER